MRTAAHRFHRLHHSPRRPRVALADWRTASTARLRAVVSQTRARLVPAAAAFAARRCTSATTSTARRIDSPSTPADYPPVIAIALVLRHSRCPYTSHVRCGVSASPA